MILHETQRLQIAGNVSLQYVKMNKLHHQWWDRITSYWNCTVKTRAELCMHQMVKLGCPGSCVSRTHPGTEMHYWQKV